jgi:U4/U6.U5 tri-snRNP-associated protein 2
VISVGSTEGGKQSATGFGSTVSPFLFLALDLPPAPVFSDENDRTVIPQVSLMQLLSKFDGKTITEFGNSMKRYSIRKLPQYLIFCVKRFTKNEFTAEKNPTIINFPLKHLDMRPCMVGLPRFDIR